MLSECCNEVNENAYPSTDFREFIDAILEANAQSAQLIACMTFIRTSKNPSTTTTELQISTQQGLVELETLMRHRRDLDAHYGWVLATDSGHVCKSLGGSTKAGVDWAKRWMKSVFDNYVNLGLALENAKQELEEFQAGHK
jgi:hypothetical protein